MRPHGTIRGRLLYTSLKPGEHPPYEVWTTADGDYVMLKSFVSGYMMTHYELEELTRS